ncbi:MAG: hypothetical protein K9J84_13600 [Bacteroidia bacterium]|nr:hypothetical protein [Bacteroidia bacterium]
MNFLKNLFSKEPPKTKEEMIVLLQESYNHYGDNEIPFIKKIMSQGQTSLKTLKVISLDNDVEVNTRKQAVCYIAKFPGDEPANFIAENFVNGKSPAQLYADYENGKDQASFAIFRQAKECLEGLGYTVG